MEIKKDLSDDNILTIKLEGRLDTTTAPELEKEIEDVVEASSVVLDFEKLEYISSAGLRLVLKIKKLCDDTKVINCNTEVYEIFKMTGFSEIMDVSKAIRKVSIDGCEVVGVGFYGTIYRLDDETVVKVFKEGHAEEEIKREIDLARKAFVLGIPTAIPYDIVEVGNQKGSVFELIDSKSLQKLIAEGADIDKIVRNIVSVMKKMHSTHVKANELPDRKKFFIEAANKCKALLPKEAGEKLMKLIYDIPMTDTMIHGDFHIKNIMMQNDELLLIDMDTISTGHPIFELGASYATYRAFACVDENNIKDFLGISEEQSNKILDLTFKYYFEGKDQAYIDDVMFKASIIGYMLVLMLRSKYLDESSDIQKQEIEYCINYLTENLPKIDSLDF